VHSASGAAATDSHAASAQAVASGAAQRLVGVSKCCAMKAVETESPSMNAGCRSTRARKLRLLGRPSSTVRSSAAESCSMHSARVRPRATSFATIESYHGGTVAPGASA
jgi:hypothetical protein